MNEAETNSTALDLPAEMPCDSSWLQGALEALLFVSDESISTAKIADALGVSTACARDAACALQASLENDSRGIQLREVAGGWRLSTHPCYHELIERYVRSWDTRKLSQAALETLAVVAYLQPTTRASVASVRGVNSDSSINSLVEKGLLREGGVQDAPGNPTLYATTHTFLEKFGLRSLADLPPLESFAPDDETRLLIAERLGATQVEQDVLYREDMALDAAMGSSLEPAATPAASTPAVRASSLHEAMQNMLSEALASSAGAVEKINFDELEFDEDD